jgi:NNP family nitrate/nitrite transporter-like MFS transporter
LLDVLEVIMAIDISILWKVPEVNPTNGKARSIPIFNPISIHGRVFLFSWLGFMVAFMSWYAFPPLMKSSQSLQVHDFDQTLTFSTV